MITPPRIVFMGSPEFALPSLACVEKFAKAKGGNLLAIFSQPDRPSGRGKKMAASSVATKAREAGITLLQPESLKNEEKSRLAIRFLEDAKPDLIVVVAYGLLLPKRVLEIPRLGCINVHASLLPAYRGAAPIQWAIAKGEVITGVTTMLLDEGLDTGPTFLQKQCDIGPSEFADSLQKRLAELGAQVLRETLEGLFSGNLKSSPQPKERISYAPILRKEEAIIDWQRPAQEIYNRLRGFYPWPGAHTTYKGEVVKIHNGHVGMKIGKTKPGQITEVNSSGISVSAGDGITLVITSLQRAGGKNQAVSQFILGHKISAGEKLGG